MKWFDGLSIYKKMISVLISTLILLGLLLGILMWNSIETSMSQQFEKRGVEITMRLASLSTEHILFNDPYALYEVANEVKNSSEDIRYVLITDHKGRLLAHTFQDGIPKGILTVNPAGDAAEYHIEKIDTNEGMMLDILAPIEHGKVGYARVGISVKYINSLIGNKLRDMIAITLLVCVVAALLTAKLTANITRPIGELVAAAREIARGNLESRVGVNTKDEIGELAADFNNMAESLVKTNKERETLLDELQEKERMRDILLSKLITAQEDERKRISRELHDETSQALTSLIVSTRLLADSELDNSQKKIIDEIREVIVKILIDVRNLAVELRPPSLDELGLAATVEKYASKYEERFGIAVDFTANITAAAMDNQVTLALYRIVQEGLTNAAKHSGAKNIKILLEERETHVLLVISDDGKGIKKEALKKAKAENRIGIYGMQERAELFGGTFSMISGSSGTSITITIPNPAPVRKEGETNA